jgi:hypothetical protein
MRIVSIVLAPLCTHACISALPSMHGGLGRQFDPIYTHDGRFCLFATSAGGFDDLLEKMWNYLDMNRMSVDARSLRTRDALSCTISAAGGSKLNRSTSS